MTPAIGHFVLHSNFRPPVTAGTYELKAEQDGLPFEAEPGRSTVKVSSPRYAMPTDQILSSFPPANAVGSFGDRLPQIVLKRRTLPWERNPVGVVGVSDTPWLALVVIAEGEGELSTPAPVADCVTPGTELLEPTDVDVDQGLYLTVTETVVRKVFPTEEDLPLLAHVREVDISDTELAGGDDDGWLAVVMANRLPVFDTANDAPVRYLACLVNVEGQLEALPPPTPEIQVVNEFEYELAQDWSYLAEVTDSPDVYVAGGADIGGIDPAVVLPGVDDGPSITSSARAEAVEANSAPRQIAGGSQKNLVDGGSLDGSSTAAVDGVKAKGAATNWASGGYASAAAKTTADITTAATDPNATYVVRAAMGAGFHYPIAVYADEPTLRFPVLAHWSFTSTDGSTFETLMQNLDVGLIGTKPPADPAAPPKPDGTAVMASGHMSLDHHTRRGDLTSAWYRGPLSPHPTQRGTLGADRVAHAADQLRIVIPDGSEDLTYAAAFEIGRLLGLSQLSVVSALLRLRQNHFGAARVRQRLEPALPFPIDDRLEHLFTNPVKDLGHLLSTYVVDQLSTDPVRFAGPRRPVADPGRPIKRLSGLSPAKLDEAVATGMGLDINVLRDRAETIGVTGALAETEVPVGQFEDVSPEATIKFVTNQLQREVVRLAEIATPPGGDRSDALDDLDHRLRGVESPDREDD